MNIGYFARRNWYPPTAGSSVHVYQVARKLSERGHQLHSLRPDIRDPSVQVYRRRELFGFLGSIDVIYIRIFGAWRTGKFGLLKWLRRRPCPVVWEINAPLEEYMLTGRTRQQIRRLHQHRRLLARLVDAAICVSQPLADYATRNWGIRQCHPIPSGSDTQMFSPAARDRAAYSEFGDCYKVVWAGSPQYPWQGAPFVREIAGRMQAADPDVRFVVIGPDKTWRKFPSLPDNLIVCGPKPYFDMPRYLASADVGFCPCLDDDLGVGFYRSPLKLFDYMASGLPMIASDNDATRAILRNGESGLLTANRVDDVVQAILQLKHDPAAAARLGEAARAEAERYYNWDRVAEQTECILQSLI